MVKNRRYIGIIGVIALLLLAITAPAFSAPVKKQLAAPKSISVSFPNDTEINNVTVTWSGVMNNSGYTVKIYKNPDFVKPLITEQISTGVVTKTFSLPYNNQYRVTVQTIGTGNFYNSAVSNQYPFNTNFNAVITNQPAGAVNGVALENQPVVKIVNPSGRRVNGFTGNVLARIATGTGTLTGTTTTAAVAGIATFSNLTLTGSDGDFSLIFSPIGISAAISNTFTLVGSTVIEGNYNCSISGYFTISSSVVTGNTLCVGAAIIPTGVTEIGGYVFNANSGLTSITIPASVTLIAGYAFYNATSLTTVNFESGSQLQEFRQGVFEGASALTSITIPASVTTMGGYVFYNATSLTTVTFESGSQLQEFRQGLFQGASALTSITIPAGVTSINQSAFEGASALTSITIPAGVTYIGGYVFYNSRSLSAIYFLGNAPSVGSNPFLGVASGASAFITNVATGFGSVGGSWNGLIVAAWI